MAKGLAIASLQILVVLLIASLAQSKPVVTRLSVYAQEFIGGPNPSLVPVAGLPNTTWGLSQFGSVLVGDHAVTTGVSLMSPEVARLQGILAVVKGAVEALTTVQFTAGKYNGSTVETKGVNVQANPAKEVAIIGGTKHFRFATGYMNFETVSSIGFHVTIRLNLTIVQDISIKEEVEKEGVYESVM